MAVRDHTDTVRDVLTGQGLGVPDSEIYAAPLDPDFADASIWIVQTPGTAPDDAFGTLESIQYPRVQVNVRNPSVPDGKADAREVWRLVHDTEPTDYSRASMMQSSPLYIGTDDDGRHRWTINAELFICE